MDEKIVWFAYHEQRPIAIFINLPDLNQWFKHLNGQFDLLHKLKFLWVKKTKPCSSAFMCVTETPEGFLTPLEAQPVRSAAVVRGRRSLVMVWFMVVLVEA